MNSKFYANYYASNTYGKYEYDTEKEAIAAAIRLAKSNRQAGNTAKWEVYHEGVIIAEGKVLTSGRSIRVRN